LGEAVAADRRALDLANQIYTAGLGDFLNVLIASRALYEAEDALAQSQGTVSLNLVALYKALGGGWETDAATTE
jgi:outer membrane protein TolC